jgi:hypothetical protein
MDVLISLASIFFGFLAIVIVVPAWLRHRSRVLALQTISEAIEKGRPSDATLIERLLVPRRPQVGKWFALLNLFIGVGGICVGVALALAVQVLEVASGDDAAGMMIGSSVNFCNGIGLTTLGLLSLRFFSGMTRPAPRWDYPAVLALIALFLGVSGICVASGLSLAAHFFVAPISGEGEADGLRIGALFNACSGVGFTFLGLFILRIFGSYKDA